MSLCHVRDATTPLPLPLLHKSPQVDGHSAILNPSAAQVTLVQCTERAKNNEYHLSPTLFIFIGKLLPSTLRWVPICHGFSDFSAFCRHFMLTKLVSSSIRVNPLIPSSALTGMIIKMISIRWRHYLVNIWSTNLLIKNQPTILLQLFWLFKYPTINRTWMI